MECYYVDEVIEQIDEEIEFFEQMVKDRGPDGDVCYALSILKHMKKKMEKLEIKDFNYQE
jgi:hypothetical protein